MRLSMLIAALLLAAGAWSVFSGQARLKFADARPTTEQAQAAK